MGTKLKMLSSLELKASVAFISSSIGTNLTSKPPVPQRFLNVGGRKISSCQHLDFNLPQ